MKNFLFLISAIFLTTALALHASTPGDEVKIIARIKTSGKVLELEKDGQKAGVKTQLARPELQKALEALEPGDEALITGRLHYVLKGVEGEGSQATFVIESIKPISLKRLGKIDQKFIEDQKQFVIRPVTGTGPKTIPVTGDVANAITMTASLLMLQNLTATEADPGVKKDLNTGLIFSAGVLATGLFIYEQLTGKAKDK